jgi:FtsP/CotA-like multicopper oxidase with cupredoxin domain
MFSKLVSRSFQRLSCSNYKFYQNRNHFKPSSNSNANWKWLGKGSVLGAGVFIAQQYVQSDDDPGNSFYTKHFYNQDMKKSSHVPHGTGDDSLPVETALITCAPKVPPPITRSQPARVLVNIETLVKTLPVDELNTYEFWTFGGNIPGPFVRARVGDVLEVHHKNLDESGMQHNIDFHCVLGPGDNALPQYSYLYSGGGAPLLTADTGKIKRACFKLQYPGLYFYHCSVDPVHVHVANGMYGLVLVEPEGGLPPAKEFYVMQSEIYATEDESDPKSRKLVMSYEDLLNEKPRYVVMNGKSQAMVETPLEASTSDRVRIFFGNAGKSYFTGISNIQDRI